MANTEQTMPKPPPNPMAHRGDGAGATQQQTDLSAHPAVQKHIAAFSDAMHTLDALRAENQRMENHIRVLEASLRDLEFQVDHERSHKEKFQRYCMKVQTLIGSMAALARQADEASVQYAMKEEAKPLAPPKSQNPIEREIDDTINELKQNLDEQNRSKER
jgi:hypothetical protein